MPSSASADSPDTAPHAAGPISPTASESIAAIFTSAGFGGSGTPKSARSRAGALAEQHAADDLFSTVRRGPGILVERPSGPPPLR